MTCFRVDLVLQVPANYQVVADTLEVAEGLVYRIGLKLNELEYDYEIVAITKVGEATTAASPLSLMVVT